LLLVSAAFKGVFMVKINLFTEKLTR
jgi:hypothetical protein